MTALHHVAANGYDDIVKLLENEKNNTPNIKCKSGNTPLMSSLYECSIDTIKLLAECTDKTITNEDGETVFDTVLNILKS